MTEETTSSSSGASAESGGQSDQDKKDTVAYETHKKLLAEKKKVQEELEALKAKDAERERKELEQQGNWKKLLEQTQSEKSKVEKELSTLYGELENAKKRNAVLKFVSGMVPDPAKEWIKVDGVALNEDGTVNLDTAKLVAQEFEKNFSFAVLKDKANGGLPADAARGGAQKLTVSQWKALPSSKEMREKQSLVDWDTE